MASEGIGLRCSCEWSYLMDGDIDPIGDPNLDWFVELDPACQVHGDDRKYPPTKNCPSPTDMRECQTFGHPFPWRHETDWQDEIYDANGQIVAKCSSQNPQVARVIRAIAEPEGDVASDV